MAEEDAVGVGDEDIGADMGEKVKGEEMESGTIIVNAERCL